MQELRMQGWSMAEWSQLLRLRTKYGKSGESNADILGYPRTWTAVISKQWPELRQCLEDRSRKTNKEKPSALERFEPALGAST
mmetsp:Transcript_28068/g.51323  ORF Transcript_28068/g.51323 Transcript_28068/m.51323 type:complete len:83 (+) Transcript_28068:707-955(+)